MSNAASREPQAVRERPIIFSGESVRAILDGVKTQTRRVVNKQPSRAVAFYTSLGADWKPVLTLPGWDGILGSPSHDNALAEVLEPNESIRCPFGQPGDRLWVREAFAGPDHIGDGDQGVRGFGIKYRADGGFRAHGKCGCDGPCSGVCIVHPWRSPIHMPRWASRLTLEIVEVRVQRLQEISTEDCKAEGVQLPVSTDDSPEGKARPLLRLTGPISPVEFGGGHPERWVEADYWRFEYANLWDSLNAKRGHSWESNPFVWVIGFRPSEGRA